MDDVVYAGTATGELIAVGLADGKLRWRYKAGEAIGESSPTVANGRVFVGGKNVLTVYGLLPPA